MHDLVNCHAHQPLPLNCGALKRRQWKEVELAEQSTIRAHIHLKKGNLFDKEMIFLKENFLEKCHREDFYLCSQAHWILLVLIRLLLTHA